MITFWGRTPVGMLSGALRVRECNREAVRSRVLTRSPDSGVLAFLLQKDGTRCITKRSEIDWRTLTFFELRMFI